MSTAPDTNSPGADLKIRGGAHYRPHPAHRTDDACRYVESLHEELRDWLADATAGRRRALLAARSAPTQPRSEQDVLADLAQALVASPEWEGALLVIPLHAAGWPVDVALVRALHTWSCRLQDRVMAAYRERARAARR